MTTFDAGLSDDEITQLLFVRNEPVGADLGMVFGAACEQDMRRRTGHGIGLWQQGFVPRLLVTGGATLAQARPEAQRMAEFARQVGFPDDCLLVEDRSANTMENAKYSADLLTPNGLLGTLRTVLLVSSEWHMGRVLLTVRRFFPPEIRFLCCPTSQGCNRHNWTESDEYRRVVYDEAVLLTTFKELGAI